MNFDVYGPFELELFGNKKLIIDETLTSLISAVDEYEEGLSNACGCYVFGVRASHGIVPWYVGQANKTTLVKESLNPSNREKYNKIIGEKKSYTPVIFLLPKLTPQGNFAKPTSKNDGLKSIHFLEEWLIASAIQKNPNMINDKKTFFLRNLYVTGLFNAAHGKATKSSSALKKVLDL